MTLKTHIADLLGKIAPRPMPSSETSAGSMGRSGGAASFQRVEARPEGWTGKPFRWRAHDLKFAFHLDDGTPVLWQDCIKPQAYRGGFRDNFQTRVLVHPSDAIGWLILETLTTEYGGIHGDQVGEYRLRRATPEECRPYFHADDTSLEYRRIESIRERLKRHFDKTGRMKDAMLETLAREQWAGRIINDARRST
ncbi:hypothetical protein [Rhizobium sp. GN54]|uniref:hypothetical protein n=1 Tax=Rhizobium sp. GN54 TaxID=2898150 RepID=UPI001E55A773|nr:hypothetical protein [Rhizobium sp. GN54]MCD2182235.1 hypothetical protein [Rhizobium sp. GN54]